VRAVSSAARATICAMAAHAGAGHRVVGSHMVVVFKPEVVATIDRRGSIHGPLELAIVGFVCRTLMPADAAMVY
jgi:hypothetical protein